MLAENIQARQSLESALELIGEQPPRFWELLAEHCATKLPAKPAPVSPEPMGDSEAYRFEQSTIPFGKYQGEAVVDVPLGYLIRLTEDDLWLDKLRRYLASGIFEQRQDD